MQYEFHFDDTTIIEADGHYDQVACLMESTFPKSKEWMIKTSLIIESSFGECSFMLHMFGGGSIKIVEYSSFVGDVYQNTDFLSCLSGWARENEWKTPEPNKELVESNKDFWKHFWGTMLVNSSYLDELYGERDINLEKLEKASKKRERGNNATS